MGKFIVLDKKAVVNFGVMLLGIFSLIIVSISFYEKTLEVANSKKLLPIYSVETDKKQVALTFDCAWGADDISAIIETLNKYNVKATFFTVGDWVKKNSGEVLALSEAGMEIRKSHFKSFTCCSNVL